MPFLQVLQEILVTAVLLALPETQDPQVSQDFQVNLDVFCLVQVKEKTKAILSKLGLFGFKLLLCAIFQKHQDFQVYPDYLARKERRETQVHWLMVLKDSQVCLDPLEVLAPRVLLVSVLELFGTACSFCCRSDSIFVVEQSLILHREFLLLKVAVVSKSVAV